MKILNLRKGVEKSTARVDTMLNDYGTGGGTGGKDNLKDLSDVSVSTRTSGQILKYNGSKWVNADLETVEVDETTIDYNSDDKLEVKDSSITPAKIEPAETVGYILQTYEDSDGNLASRWAQIPTTITTKKVSALPETLVENTLYLVETGTATIYHQYLKTSDELVDLGLTVITLVDKLNDLTDVTLTSATVGDSLVYDGTKWVNDKAYTLKLNGGLTDTADGIKVNCFSYNVLDEVLTITLPE